MENRIMQVSFGALLPFSDNWADDHACKKNEEIRQWNEESVETIFNCGIFDHTIVHSKEDFSHDKRCYIIDGVEIAQSTQYEREKGKHDQRNCWPENPIDYLLLIFHNW